MPQTPSGVRMYLPLLDGSDTVGVMALTLDAVGDDDRRLLSRLSGLVADILVTKGAYTDQFFQARRREPMSMSAEIQWSRGACCRRRRCPCRRSRWPASWNPPTAPPATASTTPSTTTSCTRP